MAQSTQKISMKDFQPMASMLSYDFNALTIDEVKMNARVAARWLNNIVNTVDDDDVKATQQVVEEMTSKGNYTDALTMFYKLYDDVKNKESKKDDLSLSSDSLDLDNAKKRIYNESAKGTQTDHLTNEANQQISRTTQPVKLKFLVYSDTDKKLVDDFLSVLHAMRNNKPLSSTELQALFHAKCTMKLVGMEEFEITKEDDGEFILKNIHLTNDNMKQSNEFEVQLVTEEIKTCILTKHQRVFQECVEEDGKSSSTAMKQYPIAASVQLTYGYNEEEWYTKSVAGKYKQIYDEVPTSPWDPTYMPFWCNVSRVSGFPLFQNICDIEQKEKAKSQLIQHMEKIKLHKSNGPTTNDNSKVGSWHRNYMDNMKNYTEDTKNAKLTKNLQTFNVLFPTYAAKTESAIAESKKTTGAEITNTNKHKKMRLNNSGEAEASVTDEKKCMKDYEMMESKIQGFMEGIYTTFVDDIKKSTNNDERALHELLDWAIKNNHLHIQRVIEKMKNK
jgi:hypothetical protein